MIAVSTYLFWGNRCENVHVIVVVVSYMSATFILTTIISTIISTIIPHTHVMSHTEAIVIVYITQ